MGRPCRCNAYNFPHRPGGGMCSAPRLTCAECGDPCSPQLYEAGEGPYEFWGARGYDRREAVLSDCCEAVMIDPRTGQEVYLDKWDLDET